MGDIERYRFTLPYHFIISHDTRVNHILYIYINHIIHHSSFIITHHPSSSYLLFHPLLIYSLLLLFGPHCRLGSCSPIVFSLSPRCFLPDVVAPSSPLFPTLPFVSHCPALISSCSQIPSCLPFSRFPAVSQMWSFNCFPSVFHLSRFPAVSPDVVSHLSPSCFWLFYRCWSSDCFPIVSQFVPDMLSQFVFHLSPTTFSCLPDEIPQ